MKAKRSNFDDNVLPGKTTTIEDGKVVGDELVEESVEIQTKKNGAMVYDESPFLRHFKIDTRKKLLTVSKGTAIMKNGDDSLPAVTRVQQEVEVDKKEFVKLFSGPDLKHVYNLAPAGLRMFMVFLDLVGKPSQMNRVDVRCTWPMVQSMTAEADEKFSYMTFNRGIKDLTDKGYIAPALIDGEKESWYWINQDKFYNGSTVILERKVRLTNRNKVHLSRVNRAVYPGPKNTDLFDDMPASFEEAFGDNGDVPTAE